MEQLQSLLDKLSKKVSRENTKLEEKKSRGESFNIFSICGVNHYEVTHSAIIAEFLAPVLLKDILRKKAEKTANNNASAGMGSQYHFKVYKE